jgi:branched-chain amino acid transport system substrate-binding protein
MQRRSLLKFAAALALSAGVGLGAAHAQDPIRIGVIGPKTGPLAGGAAVTLFPNFDLWVHNVNGRGGLKLPDGTQRKVELVVYDDRTQPGETIKAVERLATQDKVDFIMGPYGTGFHLASAPTFAKHGYPHFATTSATDKIEELSKQYPTINFWLGSTTALARSVAEVLKEMRDRKDIGNRIAMVNVGDAFGIELANAARPVFKEYGFDIVYDQSYPLGTQDLAPVVKGAKATKPDAFVALSYPPDTFGLLAQARTEGLDVKAYYSAVGTAFQSFRDKMGASAEGVLGIGGVHFSPTMVEYRKQHKEVTGIDADWWASAVVYASAEVLGQSIEAVGLDRQKVNDYIKSRTFETVMGTVDLRKQSQPWFWTVGQWQDGQFVGVKGVNTPKPVPARIKTGW